MSIMTRKSIIVLFVLALLAGFGCAKKQVSSEPGAIGTTPDETAVQETVDEEAARHDAEQEAFRQRELQEQQARQAQQEDIRAQEQQANQEVQTMVFFAFDSYDLDAKARDILQRKAQALKILPDTRIVVEGHCDERGTEEYNLALGERRARAAYEFLVLMGVNPGRMSIVSYGESRPLDMANSEAAFAKNRRAEFKVD